MLSETTQAILLLTAYFSKAAGMDVKPLTNKEWGKFAHWLKNQGLFPADLLRGDLKERLTGWSDSKITPERIQALLNRGSALAVAVEKWSRAGLWVLTRSDSDYPKRLKHRLGNDAPPVFFGAGNRSLLSQGGVAVVGSRNTSEDDLAFSRALGEQAANEGLTIVSGGARGVDESAMLGALEAEGTAIGVLANDLLRAATSAKYRRHLMSNNLVLLSPFYPEASTSIVSPTLPLPFIQVPKGGPGMECWKTSNMPGCPCGSNPPMIQRQVMRHWFTRGLIG
jgi:predicted Rossmann fold nucleotide-binding protein DprA/Smf involved in DNA uptake